MADKEPKILGEEDFLRQAELIHKQVAANDKLTSEGKRATLTVLAGIVKSVKVHVGSEMISLQIVEYSNLDNIRIIEEANQRVKLGEETFKNKKISFSLVTEICEILKGYKRLMDEYGVEEYSVQATTAVREAENQAYFLDQILVKTGLRIDVVEMPREIYTKYISILRTLDNAKEFVSGSGVLFVDISSGGLGITYMAFVSLKQ